MPNTLEVFAELSRLVLYTYTRPTAGVLHNACSRSASAPTPHRIVLEKVFTCVQRDRCLFLPPPRGHRTSNMLYRLMRGMNRYFDQANTCTARWRLADCTVVPAPCLHFRPDACKTKLRPANT